MASSVLPLGLLYTDLPCREPGTLYAEVRCTDQCDVHTNCYVAARPREGLLPLFHEADGYVFQRIFRLN